MSSPSLIAVRDDSPISESSSPGPRSGGPTARRPFTRAQKLDHLAAYEDAKNRVGSAAAPPRWWVVGRGGLNVPFLDLPGHFPRS
jgi:hypothetical protein